MQHPPRVDIALHPAEASTRESDCYVVIDTLRATTTLAALMSCGARSVTVVDSEDRARAMAREEGALLAGEVGGLPPSGFDLGNSPVEAMTMRFDGRDVVLFTTNGTRAICSVAARGVVLAGALTNSSAIVEACQTFERVTFVCAGNAGGTQFAIEDFAVAASMAMRLAATTPELERGDAVLLADLTLAGSDRPERVAELIRSGSHAAQTRALGLEADIDFACRADVTSAVPRVVAFGSGWARLEAAAH